MFYARDGRPIGAEEWSAKSADKDYVAVARNYADGWLVTTTWFGTSLDLTCEGAPLIFETMVFPAEDETGRGAGSPVYRERYVTESAALAGHDQALAWITEKTTK